MPETAPLSAELEEGRWKRLRKQGFKKPGPHPVGIGHNAGPDLAAFRDYAIELRPPDALKANPKNPRTHTKRKIRDLAAAIRAKASTWRSVTSREGSETDAAIDTAPAQRSENAAATGSAQRCPSAKTHDLPHESLHRAPALRHLADAVTSGPAAGSTDVVERVGARAGIRMAGHRACTPGCPPTAGNSRTKCP